jgi:hypothetical protein
MGTQRIYTLLGVGQLENSCRSLSLVRAKTSSLSTLSALCSACW